jgi:hypothetical protein
MLSVLSVFTVYLSAVSNEHDGDDARKVLCLVMLALVCLSAGSTVLQ